MSEKLTRDVYLQYAKKIVSVLTGDAFYDKYRSRVDEGASNFKLVKKRLVQDISIDWIETIEECLPNLDTIIRNPRKFIVQEEDIVDISLARSISTESVKHLAQHTNMISKVDEDGMVTPNKILNITKEESFEIYENRFIYTLLLKLKDFVTIRYDKIKKASATQDVLELDLESRFNLPSKKITYRTEFLAQLSFDEIMQLDPDTLTKIERIAKIDRIITDFLSSSFAKSMRNSAPVRPPITRTNVILKEPNFKKALTLWQFIETYQQTGGFSTSDDVENYDITEESSRELRDIVTLNTMLFESLYDQHETDFDMDDAEFADVLRAGEMDFKPDEIDRDQYAQELEEKELNPEEEKKEETEEPEEPETAEEQPPEEPETVEEEVEIPVDQDKEIEAPPKEEPEDTEPDAEQFDQNLFDVRKLYKRPKEDKLRQEEIIKVKDAIDRCLSAYRKIKQEEIDELEREETRRLRREEIEKRAEAFRKQRDAMELEFRQNAESVYFGKDPFHSQAVKLVLPSSDTDYRKEHKELFVKKNEKLDLNDSDLVNIRKSIQLMEQDRLEQAKLLAEEAKRSIGEEYAEAESVTQRKDAETLGRAQADVDEKEHAGNTEADKAVDVKYGGAVNEKEIDNAENISENSETKPPAAVKKRRKGAKEAVGISTGPAESASIADEPSEKPKIRISKQPSDPWSLSPTTLNQKYSKASGKKVKLEAVDEKKVAVGGIRIEKEREIDPYAELEKLKRANKKSSDEGNIGE